MKLFGARPTAARPVAPRVRPMSDDDLLHAIWGAWLTAQPLQDQISLFQRQWIGVDTDRALEIAADPVYKLTLLHGDEAMPVEVRVLAELLLNVDEPTDIPVGLARAADATAAEREATSAVVRNGIGNGFAPNVAEAAAFVIAYLIGTELHAGAATPRRLPIARGVTFVALRELGLPINRWEAQLRAFEEHRLDTAVDPMAAAA